MLNRKSLDMVFNRVLMSSQHTKLAKDIDPSTMQEVTTVIGREYVELEFVALSYMNDKLWMLICTDDLYWMNESGLHSVSVSSLSFVKGELDVNADLGFSIKEGMKYMTLGLVNGDTYHVQTEPGSSFDAMQSVISRIIYAHQNC